MPIRASVTAKDPQATSLRILVGLTIALAVLGFATATVLLARSVAQSDGNVVGQPVDTSFGAFTVTNVKTTFVPDTQGPPTAAQHDGTKGITQLQVWIRLVNNRADNGLAYTSTQLRLIKDPRTGKGQDPDGSSIKQTLLPIGASIDGQVWFDLPKGGSLTGAGWWLEFKDPDGDPVRIALGPPQVVSKPATHSDSKH